MNARIETAPVSADGAPSAVVGRFGVLGAGALRGLLARRGVLAVADQGIVSATSFVTSLLLGRLCPESELGVYFLALGVFYFIRGLQEQLIAGPYIVHAQRRDAAALPAYAGSVLVHHAAFAVLTLGGLGVVAAALNSGFGPQRFISVIPVLLVAFPPLLLRDLLRQLTFAAHRLPRALFLDAGASSVQLTVLGLLWATDRLSVVTAFLAMSAGCVAASALWFLAPTQPWHVRLPNVMTDLRANWAFGRWALASQLIGCSLPYVTPWIVATTEGEHAAGVLGASGTLVGVANLFVIGICNALAPRAARAWIDGGADELRPLLRRTALLFATTLGAFCLAATCEGALILRLVFGRELPGGGLILSLLSVNMLSNALGMVAGNGLCAIDRPKANFTADLAAFAVTLAGLFALAPAHGALGTVVATMVGTTAGAAVRGVTVWNALRRHPTERSARSEAGGAR